MIRLTETKPYAGPFPRKRHYHRCPKCFDRGGNGVNCYKSKCTLPRDLKVCSWCGTTEFFTDESPADAVPVARKTKPKARELEQIPVDPARVGWGPKNDGSTRGDINRSYSAQSIAENKGKIKTPFRHAGADWVSIGSGGRGSLIGRDHEECYRVVAREAFDGEAWKYGEHIAAGYHGMLVDWKGRAMVLAGPSCVFVADPQLAAVHLFDDDGAGTCEGCGESECECGDPEDEPEDFGLDFDAEEIAEDLGIEVSEVIPPVRSKPVQLSLFGDLL